MSKTEREKLDEELNAYIAAASAAFPWSASEWENDGPRICGDGNELGRMDRVRFAEYVVAAVKTMPKLLEAFERAEARIAELEAKLASFKPWPPPGVDIEEALKQERDGEDVCP